EEHIFNLYVTPESKGKEPRYENVTAKKLIEGTKWFRHIRKLHRTSVDFEKKTLPIDPWFLGVLLGDGFLASSTVSLTTGNEDVIRRAKIGRASCRERRN